KKTGEVVQVLVETRKLLVRGINMVKKHQKPTQTSPGGIVQKELPIDISNVALIDPKSGKATRTGVKVGKDGTKERVAKKSGQVIAKPVTLGVKAAKPSAKAKGKGGK
ncbi:MAG: 50S ribosomal protein L24, partial [Alphaproteobacteria bacterium]|nr:50S ribosomal protein L24 [Alphaproteobacteria bacterium]